MYINIPVSLGELVDKISILQIKKKNIKNLIKQKLIKEELKLLKKNLKNVLGNKKEIKEFLNKLIIINTKLWKIEDKLRECELKKIFNEKFTRLARSVYVTNDERSKIKLEINKKFSSKIIEVKSYKKYQ